MTGGREERKRMDRRYAQRLRMKIGSEGIKRRERRGMERDDGERRWRDEGRREGGMGNTQNTHSHALNITPGDGGGVCVWEGGGAAPVTR